MIFRVINEERMPQVEELWTQCFEKRGEPFFERYFSTYCGRDNTVLGGFDEQNHLLTMLHLNPYMLQLRGVEILTPYIVGVATDARFRGQHLMGELLKMSFQVLRSQKFPFVFLRPVAEVIYRPYGFTGVDYHGQPDLHRFKSDFDLTPVALDDADAVKMQLSPFYNRYTADKNTVLRTDFQWHKLLGMARAEGTKCYFLYKEGLKAGYALVQDDGQVAECIVPEGLQTEVSSDRAFIMARCIDARAALSRLPVPEGLGNLQLNLLLTDSSLSENSHLLHIEIRDGQLKFSSTVEPEDVTMKMEAFTRLCFGAEDLLNLVADGSVKVQDATKLAGLAKLFPVRRTYINEYF